ncbi:hypothetical protein Patl1_06801 [Pistacia atlantica]|uniref:Uncharacterized protein n=1 Tax=Pistacia atlantica TaxID=434234 RepID=A0ACC1BRF0_9ROSI|nr:hypothetical protein Patl1_06801 [Pistacia atlantica]
MSGENYIVRFNGKNYASWEFQFRLFVKGKELWGHLDESSKAPTDPKGLSLWESKDARIASWLLSSVEPHMVNNLHGFTTVKVMWDYLRQFIIKIILLETLAALQTVHSESQRDQFLMKLRPEFESARAGLINRTPFPSLEHTLLKVEDDPDLHHNVIVARKLGTLPNIAARNSSAFVPISSTLPAIPSSSSNITLEKVQQMIISTLSALGLQDVRNYDGEQHIQIADGSTLPITAVGNLGSSIGTGDSEGA